MKIGNPNMMTKRKLIYEIQKPGGRLQIWEENGKYFQVNLIDGKISKYKCKKNKNKIICGNITLDLNKKQISHKPININKEAYEKISYTDKIIINTDKIFTDFKDKFKTSYSNLFLEPIFKGLIVGGLLYLTFIIIKSKVMKDA